MQEEVISCRQHGALALISLKRPAALNALSSIMIQKMDAGLKKWRENTSVKAILVEGEGRAFCAGADIVAAYKARQDFAAVVKYFEEEYELDKYIGSYPKPYISYLDGIVMGAGAGISMHGSYRIATKNTVFAMPEAAIGLFTDAGAAVFLKSLPLPLRLYVCLSGARINGGDCVRFGLATHAMEEQNYPILKDALSAGEPVEEILEKHCSARLEEGLKPEELSLISDCFSAPRLTDCVRRVKNHVDEGNAFAKLILEALERACPYSLQIIFLSIHYGAKLSLPRWMDVEKKIVRELLSRSDFYEGVRAMLIDKDHSPLWQSQAELAEDEEKLADWFYRFVEDVR